MEAALVALAIAIAIVVVAMLAAAFGRGRRRLHVHALAPKRFRLHAVVDPTVAVARVPAIAHVVDGATLVDVARVRFDANRLVFGFDEHCGLGAGVRVTTGTERCGADHHSDSSECG